MLETNEFLKIMIDLIINHALTIKHNNNWNTILGILIKLTTPKVIMCGKIHDNKGVWKGLR